MSAIADFSVAVLDCHSCCRHFIESYVAVAKHGHRVACPHCGADYVEPADTEGFRGGGERMSRQAHARRGVLHRLDQRRRKLQ